MDASIGPIGGNERGMDLGHIDRLPGMESRAGMRELVIFDCGCPSGEFVRSLRGKGIAFVMRVRKDFLPGRGARDAEAAMCKGGPLARAVRFALAAGEEETLVASLPESEVGHGAFAELYNKRWGIETKYRELRACFTSFK